MSKKKIEIAINQLSRVHVDMNECANKFILKDAIDQLQDVAESIDVPVAVDCSTCIHIKVSKHVSPCYGCRDNDGYDNYEKK